MHHGWGSFRTTTGEVSVGDDAIRIDRSPRVFIRGQLSRWRRGSSAERATALVRITGFLFGHVLLLYRLLAIGEAGTLATLLSSLCLAAVGVGAFWVTYLRATTVPLAAVTRVTVDADERELVVVVDPEQRATGSDARGRVCALDRLVSLLWSDDARTTLPLRSEDDVRAARAVFRTRGVLVADDPVGPVETVRRVTTRGGAVFCEDCGTQVSPADRTCPACDYALRVERPRESDALRV
jgi:hypothetical protein